MIDLIIVAAIMLALGKRRSNKLPFNKDKLPQRPPAPMTARELLVEAFGESREEHADHSVKYWRKSLTGSLQIYCTCGGMASTPDTTENRLALQNMRRVR